MNTSTLIEVIEFIADYPSIALIVSLIVINKTLNFTNKLTNRSQILLTLINEIIFCELNQGWPRIMGWLLRYESKIYRFKLISRQL